MRNGVPTVALVGYGRAGKDTCAEWLAEHTNLRHCGSTSDTMAPLVALVKGMQVKECHERRHENRKFWKEWCNRFRDGTADDLVDALDRLGFPFDVIDSEVWKAIQEDPGLVTRHDPAKIIRIHLRKADVVPGIRGRAELLKARDEGLLDLIVWIENPRVEPDFTVDFRKEDADVVILNDSSKHTFYYRLRRLTATLKGVELRS